MSFKVVIPSRYNSTRLAGKPLIEIAGLPMVIHVARKARLSGADEVIVATDDERIFNCVEQFGFKAIITDPEHSSGTDRINEVLNHMDWNDETIIINLQGDEPLIDPLLINKVAHGMSELEVDYATAASSFERTEDFANVNNVKVVLGRDDYALYFSRSMIPYDRVSGEDSIALGALQHIGIYGYTAKFLRFFCGLPKSNLERIEGLEQLRALENHQKIKVFKYDGAHSIGVDTQEDLDKIKKILGSN